MRGSMKVKVGRRSYDLYFNENGAMFYTTKPGGDVKDWMSARALRVPAPNQAWILRTFLNVLVETQVVTPVMDGPNLTIEDVEVFDLKGEPAVLCNVIHPLFNDQGYSNFGDFCRSRLGQQSQYGSRYIDGRLDGYPALGDGLRFNNGIGYKGEIVPADATDYHTIRIHRDDMDEFERRYKAYCEERING